MELAELLYDGDDYFDPVEELALIDEWCLTEEENDIEY